MWIKHDEDTRIPEWLRGELDSNCMACNTPMENFYLDINHGISDRCTNRRCPNPACPSTLAVKISNMADILKWKGIGEETGRKTVISYKLTNHLQAIPYLTQEKPKMSINTLLRICFIPGMATRCDKIKTDDYATVEEFIKGYRGEYYKEVEPYTNLLMESVKYVDISSDKAVFDYDPILFENVTITGNVNNLPDRSLFPLLIAKLTKGLVHLSVVGLRKTNVTAVIKEDGAAVTGKIRNAIECGIPILTSDEYIAQLMVRLQEELKRRNML